MSHRRCFFSRWRWSSWVRAAWIPQIRLILASLVLIGAAGGCTRSDAARAHLHAVAGIAFSPDGQLLASGGADDVVRLWTGNAERELAAFKNHSGGVRSVAFSPDSTVLASGDGNGLICLWNVQDRKGLKDFQGHTQGIQALAFSPDGKTLASGSIDKTVRFWSIPGGRELPPKRAAEGTVRTLAFAPNGEHLAAAGEDGVTRFWSVHHPAETSALPRLASIVNALAYSPDGSLLATAGEDRIIRLWDVKKGTEQSALKGHEAEINALTFDKASAFLYSGSADKTVRKWNVATGIQAAQFQAHPTAVKSIAMSHDDKALVSGGSDGSLVVWDPANEKKPLRYLEMSNAWDFWVGLPTPRPDYINTWGALGALAGCILVWQLHGHMNDARDSEPRWPVLYKMWHCFPIFFVNCLKPAFVRPIVAASLVLIVAVITLLAGWFVGCLILGQTGGFIGGAIGLFVGLFFSFDRIVPKSVFKNLGAASNEDTGNSKANFLLVLCCAQTGLAFGVISSQVLALITRGGVNLLGVAAVSLMVALFIRLYLNTWKSKEDSKHNWAIAILQWIVGCAFMTPLVAALKEQTMWANFAADFGQIFGGSVGTEAVLVVVLGTLLQLPAQFLDFEKA